MDDLGEIIQGWKPSTTHALLYPNRAIDACDVIDRSMGLSFLRNLKIEINQKNIIEKMKPSITANDLVMGQQQSDLTQKARGDLSVIIPRSFRCTDEFNVKYSTLKRLITSVERSASHHVTKCDDRGTYLNIDYSLTSVQVAMYPGDGVSGYTRHCDRSGGCHQSPTLNLQASSDSQRILTAIYYITDEDWSENDGGFLTIFDRDDRSSHRIIPYPDRLVVFRSDLVEHQVTPSLHRARLAVTIWLYGKLVTCAGFQRHRVASLNFESDQTQDKKMIPLPILSSASSNALHETIFVSIPSYRDTETIPTMLSLFENASNPSRIFIGIVFQFDTKSQMEHETYYNMSSIPSHLTQNNVRSLILDYRHATGPCYARYLAQSLHRDEKYILQIDSHMRFRPNWDNYLISSLEKCPNPQKSVLTAYPPPYFLPNNIPNQIRTSILVPWKFDPDGMMRQKGRLLAQTHENSFEDGNIKCLLFAAGFNFSISSVLKDCPYDKTLHYLFFGEEQSMAIRLYTHGYDLYSPPQSVCYHLWTREHRTTLQEDLRVPGKDLAHSNASSQINMIRSSSQEKVRSQMLSNSVDGVGSTRRVSDFASELGVDFEKRTVSNHAFNGGLHESDFDLIESVHYDALEEVLQLVKDVMKM